MYKPDDYAKVTGGEELGHFSYNFNDAFEGVGEKARKASKIDERRTKRTAKETKRALKESPVSHIFMI